MTAVGTDDILKLEVTLTDDLSSVYEYMVVCTCINSVVGVIFREIMNEICSKFNEKLFHYACNKCLKLGILLAFFFLSDRTFAGPGTNVTHLVSTGFSHR